jgi:hypothetical protein
MGVRLPVPLWRLVRLMAGNAAKAEDRKATCRSAYNTGDLLSAYSSLKRRLLHRIEIYRGVQVTSSLLLSMLLGLPVELGDTEVTNGQRP